MNEPCESANTGAEHHAGGESVRLEPVGRVCPACENYATLEADKPVAVLSCEGACLRGEVARQAANLLCHAIAPERTARICLGGAFTKDTGQRALVRNATRVVALEGCFIRCSSRMMRAVVPGLEPEVVIADQLFDFDRSLFGIDQMPRAEIEVHARAVAEKVAGRLIPAN